MKIRYSYRNYGENSEATEWSERAGRWSAGGFAIAICIGFLFSEIMGSFGLGVVIGIVIVVAVVVYCNIKEKECVEAEMTRKLKDRELTEQERLIALLYHHKTAVRQSSSKAVLTALCMNGLANGEIASGEVVYVGRDPHLCQLVFPQDATDIGKVHCMLHTDGKKIELRDMNSQYGTFLLDGTRLKPNETLELKSGSSFYLGQRTNTVIVVASPSNCASRNAENKFVCTACNSQRTGWYQKCPNCGANGTMKRIEK